MYAIPNTAADKYKNVNPTTGEPAGGEDASYRRFINAKETVRQFTRRYQQGADFDPIPAQGNPLAFNCFRSASEICEMWLVRKSSPAPAWTRAWRGSSELLPEAVSAPVSGPTTLSPGTICGNGLTLISTPA